MPKDVGYGVSQGNYATMNGGLLGKIREGTKWAAPPPPPPAYHEISDVVGTTVGIEKQDLF